MYCFCLLFLSSSLSYFSLNIFGNNVSIISQIIHSLFHFLLLGSHDLFLNMTAGTIILVWHFCFWCSISSSVLLPPTSSFLIYVFPSDSFPGFNTKRTFCLVLHWWIWSLPHSAKSRYVWARILMKAYYNMAYFSHVCWSDFFSSPSFCALVLTMHCCIFCILLMDGPHSTQVFRLHFLALWQILLFLPLLITNTKSAAVPSLASYLYPTTRQQNSRA